MALSYFRKAIMYADNNDSIQIFNNLGTTYDKLGFFDSSFYFFQSAFDLLRPGMNENKLLDDFVGAMSDSRIIEYVTELIVSKASAYLHKYESTNDKQSLQLAINTSLVADRLLARIRKEHTAIESKLFWRENTRLLYENAIKACFLANNKEKAFYFFEKSRSVLLSEQLDEQYWLKGDDIVKQAELKTLIHHLQLEADTLPPSSDRNIALRSEILSARQKLEKLRYAVGEKNPYYYYSFLDSNFISIRDIQYKILKTHSALIEMFNGDSAVYVMIITEHDAYFNKIDKELYSKGVVSLISYISDFEAMNSKYGEFLKISSTLYKLIFSDFKLPAGRIIISPDGLCFPFECIVTSLENGNPSYFLENHAVSYTYSAGYLLNPFSSGQTSYSNFMGAAPVSYIYNPQLSFLKGSDQSLRRIASNFYNPDILLGSAASRNAFMNQYARYKIVQLYAHASDSSNRGEPVIWFADSALYLSDLISEERPITRLIVLSACQTGIGRLYEGEGVFSFNRGFAALGIPAAITNLWSIDSKSTYDLTELFYKYLRNGEPTDIALQKAKLEFIKLNPESFPYHWAAPILTGKAEVIELKKPVNWTWIILSISILSLLLFVWYKRMRSAQTKVSDAAA